MYSIYLHHKKKNYGKFNSNLTMLFGQKDVIYILELSIARHFFVKNSLKQF